ncbi:MAG: MFS transporter [Candidatus Lokiarchaeota archaeon]|nr:MFS transporter [Candidatus Lokiarchaeota archaeon]MBD3199967.1 MFS transporter [Candidatus Lokiarchaeota archaeon]
MENTDDKEYLKKGQKIPIKEKLSFGVGILANTIIAGIVSLYLLDYFVNEVKLDLELFVIANIIFLFYNAVNDVIFGFYSDRSTHKLGRRIPYIRYGAFLFVISFLIFWFPLPGYNDPAMGQIIIFLQLLFGLLFYDTMLTIVVLSIVSLPPEMSESTEQRASISFYNTIFTLIGGISIFIVPLLFNLGLDIFRTFTLIIGVIALICFIILSYGVKERKELHSQDELGRENILREIIQTFKNRSFISFLIFNFSNVFMTTLALNYTPIFGLIFRIDDIDTIVLLIFYMGFIISLPFYLIFIKRIDMRKIILKMTVFVSLAIFILFLFDLLTGISEVYWIIFVLNGMMMGMNIFYYPFISDAIDVDELNTNRRREGMHFGMNALITKPAEQLPAIIGGWILIMTNYEQGGSGMVQPISAILGLKFLVAIVPLIFALLTILSQLLNPLKGAKLIRMKEEILILHKEKEKNA